MNLALDVVISPQEFPVLAQRELSRTTCVVFDILRATSSMTTALAHGADSIIPVQEVSEALEIKRQRPEVLLAGERQGVRITQASIPGGSELYDFDFGNSPLEFVSQELKERVIAWTTTNGTRAIRACARARRVLIGSVLNLQATWKQLESEALESLLIVCAGTHEEIALEDVIAAGALIDRLMPGGKFQLSDGAVICRNEYQLAKADLLKALGRTKNGARLLSMAGLEKDVAFCARTDVFDFAVELASGDLRRIKKIQ